MSISEKHQTARADAAAQAAMQASVNLLNAGEEQVKIHIYSGDMPYYPEDPPNGSLLATFELEGAPAFINDSGFLELDVEGVEALVTGAGEGGTDAGWARIIDSHGDPFWDETVKDFSSDGGFRLNAATLINGTSVMMMDCVFSRERI